MAKLVIRCPVTDFPIGTGIENDIDTLAGCWNKPIQILCPHCNARHEQTVRGAVFASEAFASAPRFVTPK